MDLYDNLGVVGEGSYGTVMKCRHKENGHIVAIKKFIDKEDDKNIKKIVTREVKLLRQFHHENLVNMLEVFRFRKRLYLVFEYMDRTVLEELERNPWGLDHHRLRKHIFQILRAVEYLHSNSIIHRDIKPENVLVSNSGVVKLCDFGFARTLAPTGEPFTDYVATRWYRAPELLVGDKTYSKPVDVWAVGCLIIEMSTSMAFLTGTSDLDQLHKIVSKVGPLTCHQLDLYFQNPSFAMATLPEAEPSRDPRRKYHKLHPLVAEIVDTCLQIDPSDRMTCCQILGHRYFTKDQFPERFIPEIQALLEKDARVNNMPRSPSSLLQKELATDTSPNSRRQWKEPEKQRGGKKEKLFRASRRPERKVADSPVTQTRASTPEPPLDKASTPATITMPPINTSNYRYTTGHSCQDLIKASRGSVTPRCRCACRCACRKAKRLPSPADPAGGTSLEPEDDSSQQVELTCLAKKKAMSVRDLRFPGLPVHRHQVELKLSDVKPAKHSRKEQSKEDSRIPSLLSFDFPDQGSK
ncbi:cyclin-dependent kinase-like 4 [Osmerus mordax]|uniref:cyclin-dependent kinase-like 4 n=1 Tax=Osmerus mordax TaxID=8014 RepID=UPI0035105B27